MKPCIFVDGQEGTTGLQIHDRLANRTDIEILRIDADKRKDLTERRRLLNTADIVFLCLPDDAARESVAMIDNNNTRVIDASTAHRIDPEWVYGFPEMSLAQREAISIAKRVANPGCYATGFIAAIQPLVLAGLVGADYPINSFGISGYSGAGKKAIAQYEQAPTPDNMAELAALRAPRPYALGLKHKHVPEMQHHSGLSYPPIFTPVIANYAQGMVVSVPLCSRLLPGKASAADVRAVLARHYQDARFINVAAFDPEGKVEGGFLNPQALNGTNRLDLFVFGHDDQIMICARLDNLGKGASGAAIQNMNLMLGADEGLGL